MSSNIRYHYYVEGPCEKKLIDELKKVQAVISGPVNVFNAAQEEFSQQRLRVLSSNTIAIIILDTDAGNYEILSRNVRILKKNRNIKDIWLVLQVENLEKELLRVTDVKEIKDLIGSKSNKDFKTDFINEKNLLAKLMHHNMNYALLWASKPNGIYKEYKNDGYRIKRVDSLSSVPAEKP